MSMQAQKPLAIAANEGIEQAEAHMLNLPQAECPVVHHFGPGIYVREVTLPAGTFAIGHHQKFDHLNIMLTGKVAIIDGGSVRVLEAPMIFVGKPGRKAGYIIETCVWQNIYATEETDIDTLEATFLDKSATWNEYEEIHSKYREACREEDRQDYIRMLSETGFTDEVARAQSEDESDQIEMPHEYISTVSVRKSDIEGDGLFSSHPVRAGTVIAPARIKGMRTSAGRFTNHSKDPNCEFIKGAAGDIFLVSIKDISGCYGGNSGEELTVDYRQSLKLAKELSCQE